MGARDRFELGWIIQAKEIPGWTGEVARFTTQIYPNTGLRYNELRLAGLDNLDTTEWEIFVRRPKGEQT